MPMSFLFPFCDPDDFDVKKWHPLYLDCRRYFLDNGQHCQLVKSTAAMVNIKLPCQRLSKCFSEPHSSANLADQESSLALIPYVRRLVATGLDSDFILEGFFGDGWAEGIGPIRKMERRNYLFAAKSDSWLKVKASYDMEDGQMIPFLCPLRDVSELEIVEAENAWGEWLAMQDWMLGLRAPPGINEATRLLGQPGRENPMA